MAEARHEVTIILQADAGRLGSGFREGREELEGIHGAARQAGQGLDGAGASANQAGTHMAATAGQARQAANEIDGMGKVSQLAGGLLGTLGMAMGALGLGATIADLFQTNMQFEGLRASLTTVTGSAELASQAFEGIQTFAASTPFSVKEVTEAFISLQARGLEPSERALMSYGNTAGGLNKTLTQMIEAVADAATGEFERLKEFGINASKQGEEVAFTFKGVTTSVKNDATSITEYLIGLGEVDFAGGMERQAQTMKGALSNLGDAWDALLDTMMSEGAAKNITTFIGWISNALGWVKNEVLPAVEVGYYHVVNAIATGSAQMAGIAYEAWEGIRTSGEVAMTFVTRLSAESMALMQGGWISLQGVGEVVWVTIKSAAGAAINWISGMMSEFVASAAAGLEWLGATETANSMKAMADALNPAKQGFGELKDKIGEVNAVTAQRLAKIDEEKDKTLAQSGALKTANQSYAEMTARVQAYQTETKNTVSALDKEADATVKLINEHKNQRISLNDLSGQLPKNVQATKDLTDAEQKLLDKTNPLAAAQREHGEQLKSLKGLLDSGKISQEQYTQSVAGADAQLQKKIDSLDKAKTAHGGHSKAVDDGQKAEEKWNQELMKTIGALNPAQKATDELAKTTLILEQALAKGRITQEIYNQKLFEANNVYEASVNKVEKLTQAKQKQQTQTERLIADLEEELALMGYTGTELEVQTALRHAHAEGVMDQDQRIRDLIETVNRESEAVRAQEQAWQSVDDAFRSFFESGLTNFSQFATDIKDAFIKLLADLAYAALKNKLLISVGLSASGAAAAGGGTDALMPGSTGGGLDLSSVGNLVSNLVGGGSLLGGAASWLGATAFGGTAFGGGMVAGMAGAAGGIGGMIGALGAGISQMAAGAVAAGIGTALGAVVPVVGWIVAIAGALGAFSSDSDVTPDLKLGMLPGRNPAGPGEAFVTPEGNASFNLKTTLGPDIPGFAHHIGDAEAAQKIIDAVKASLIPEEILATAITGATAERVNAALEAAAKKMKIEEPEDFEKGIGQFFGDRLRVIIANIDGPLLDAYNSLSALGEVDLNNTQEAMQLATAMVVVSQATGDLRTTFDSLLNPTLTSVDAIAALSQEGEILATTVVRLGAQLVGVNEILDLFGAQTLDLSLAGATAADNLINLLGGVQGFQQATSAYFQAFFSEQEQFQVRVDGLREQFAGMGVELPTTTQGLRDLVAGLDLTSESGQETFAKIMQLTPALKEYIDWSDKQFASIRGGIDVVSQYTSKADSLWKTYQDSTAAVSDLLFQTDLSVQSTEDLAAAADRRRVAELALLQQIDQSISSINQSYDDFAEQIRLAGMSQEQQYQYFWAQAQALAGSLDSITDPEDYAAAVAEIERLTQQAWNALGQDQRAGLSKGFQAFLDEVQAAANERLEGWRASLVSDDANLGEQLAAQLDPSAAAMKAAAEMMENAIRTAMAAAAADMQSAGATQTTAASTMAQAAQAMSLAVANMPTTFNVQVDGSEVG